MIERILLERMDRLDREIWEAVDMQEKCKDDKELLAFWERQEASKIMVYMELRSLLKEIA